MADCRVVHAVCSHDCPDTCGMLVSVQAGRAMALRGDPDHRFTPPEPAAAATGLTASEIEAFGLQYGRTRPTAIRLGFGMNRHAGGGMAVRTITSQETADLGGGATFFDALVEVESASPA